MSLPQHLNANQRNAAYRRIRLATEHRDGVQRQLDCYREMAEVARRHGVEQAVEMCERSVREWAQEVVLADEEIRLASAGRPNPTWHGRR